MPSVFQPVVNLLRRAGVVVARSSHRGARYLEHPPATAFHDVLLRIFPDLHGLRFIQVGANDGSRADPLQPFIDHYAWTGLMIEPLGKNFSALQAHRGGNPRLRLRHAAVDVTPGRRMVYDLSPATKTALPDWAGGLGSFSRARLEQVTRELNLPDTAITSEEVDTIAWDEVWRVFGAERCDLLVLDTEGYDLTLLRASGLAAHRPRLILFEHACNPVPERIEFYRELLELGYDLATCEGDTVASLPATK